MSVILCLLLCAVFHVEGFEIPGDEETEADLLVPLENLVHTDPRVFRTKGLDGLPAVGIKRGVEIVVPYRIYLPRKFYRNFAILASVKPADNLGGYLFAVLNAFDTVVDLGLLLQPAGGSQTNITLLYTDSQAESESKVLASFLVPSFINQWTQIAVEVNENTVALYFRCMRFATRQVSRRPLQLQLDDASKLYVANAGPIIGGGFESLSAIQSDQFSPLWPLEALSNQSFLFSLPSNRLTDSPEDGQARAETSPGTLLYKIGLCGNVAIFRRFCPFSFSASLITILFALLIEMSRIGMIVTFFAISLVLLLYCGILSKNVKSEEMQRIGMSLELQDPGFS
ncbi:collagen alpha-1(XVIII) chain [Ditylenchus destructor]|nr:collagen alpha-1(XVIII) chain [Ditylenchus destructor]